MMSAPERRRSDRCRLAVAFLCTMIVAAAVLFAVAGSGYRWGTM